MDIHNILFGLIMAVKACTFFPSILVIPMKTSRWCVSSVLLLPLLVACGGKPEPVPVAPIVMVDVVGAGAQERTFPGEVRARQESTLSFQVAGRLVKRHVDAGDRVRAGQVLAELDVSDYALQTQAANAQLAAAQAELKRAGDDLARYRALAEQQLVSKSALAAQQTAFDAAQAQVRAAQAQRDVTANQAGYAQLRAPADGVIASRQAEPGQVLAAGQPVLVMAADSGREVLIALPEASIGDYAVGQPASVELWNAPGQRLAGSIREIAAAADAQTRTYAARVTIEDAGAVTLGQSARVHLAAAGAPLSVPLGAVQGESGSQQAAVFTVDPASMTLKRVPVNVARWGQQRAELAAGVSAGQWVVAAGGHLLADGQQVRAVDRDNRPLKAPAAPAAAVKAGE